MSVENLRAEVENLGREEWQDFLAWAVTEERSRRETFLVMEDERVATAKALWEANADLKPDFVSREDEQPKPEKLTKTALVELYPPYKEPKNPWEIYPLGSLVSHKREVYRKDSVDNSKGNKPPHANSSGWTAVTDEILAGFKEDEAVQVENGEEVDDGVKDFRHNSNLEEGGLVRKDHVVYRVSEDHKANRNKPPADNPDQYERLYDETKAEEETGPEPSEAGQEAEETVQAPYAE